MRIEKLDIQGFKSFADRVSMRFGRGITGVVGPNGCGKSNVVDALRWVMGEMSAKHLRGASMQDVIFNGSEKRGPTGMAEVTVTFENDGASVPLEYANFPFIEVTRRLFRDGNSDYLINKTPCRLKDITDLFLGTGIGTKGFSIIEQGQVSTLVKAKPEDRRRIIEEAAGITKYKARRQAAERKMDQTRHNLERVSDVINELSRRLGTLRRQAKKAERYRELKAEIRGIELQQAALQFLELSTGLVFDRELAGLERELLVGKEERVVELDGKIETERLSLLDDDSRLAKAQARLYELDNAISLSEQQREHATTSLESGKKREASAREEMGGLREALGFIAAQRDNIKKDTDELAAEAETHEGALEEADARVEELNLRRQARARDTEALRTRVLAAVTHAAAAKGEHDTLADKREQLRLRAEELAGTLVETQAQLTERQVRIAALEEERGQAERARGEADEDRQQRIAELNENRRALEELGQRVEEQRAITGEKRSRLASLEEIAESFERAPEGVRALMQRGDNEERGIRGLLADLFEASAEVERSVEALLGPRVQAVVVDSSEAAKEALVFLRESGKGRAEVLVASALPAPPSSLPLPGAKRLFDSLTVPPQHRAVLESLLGRAYLSDDEDRAFSLWAEARALGATLVTPRGEVLFPDGSVRGGAEAEADTGLLRQKRQIRELTEQVAAEEERLAALVAQRDERQRAVASLSSRVEELAQETHRLQLLEVEKRQELARALDDRSRLSQRQDETTAARDKAAEETRHVEMHLAERLRQREAAEHERAEAERELEAAAAQQGSLDHELHEATERATQLKIRVASHRQRTENLKQSLDHQDKNEADVRARTQRLEQQVKEVIEERQRHELLIVESTAKMTQLGQERADVKGALDRDRAAYEDAAEKVRALEHEMRSARTQVDEVRQRMNALSMRLRERELELVALSQRTEASHGVKPQEVVYDFHLLPLPEAKSLEKVKDLRRQLDAMGEINLTAIEEADTVEKRYDFLKGQSDDLTHALTQLEKAILKINRTTKKRFLEAFESINENFQRVFPRLFRGGKAWLALTDPTDMLLTGVEIFAQPPGKKLSSVALMSGGEQALTAVSLIFSIFLIKPSPFCLLDEVDAPLDEANVGRFNEMIKDVSNISQFIVITHNKRTMENADQLYGVTMEEPGISKMVNVRMSAEAGA
jgi:chromosome segregation protein